MSGSRGPDGSGATLQRFLDAAVTALIRCTADLRYTSVNSAYGRLVGLPVGDIVGRTLAEVDGEAVLTTIRPHLDRVLAGARVEYEAQLVFPMTGSTWIHAVYVPDLDASGAVVGWFGSVLDISERKRQQHLQFVSDHVPVFLVHCDADARYTFVNAP